MVRQLTPIAERMPRALSSQRKHELIDELKALRESSDPEAAHMRADEALLDYIADDDIREVFTSVSRWYA